MTRKDFARMARALTEARKVDLASLTTEQYELLVDHVALACGELSPGHSFHYATFRAACGLED